MAASPGWVAACLVATALTYVMAAVATRASTDVDLPLRRTVGFQLASSFANRLVPAGVAGKPAAQRLEPASRLRAAQDRAFDAPGPA